MGPLKIREQDGMTFIDNCTIMELDSETEASKVYSEGIRTRKTAATNYNEHSSRSHLIFSVIIESHNIETGETTYGKLSLVDLAGSEKLKDESNSLRRDEGIKVNLSLSALKNVIQKLTEKGNNKHIPYKDNILTSLLKDSLGGNAKTLVIVSLGLKQLLLECVILNENRLFFNLSIVRVLLTIDVFHPFYSIKFL